MNEAIAKREFARVRCRLPVRVRVLSEEQANQLAERMHAEPTYVERASVDLSQRGETTSWERLAFATILTRLETIEKQIARLARGLDVDLASSKNWIEGETVDLSGNGMGIWLNEPLEDDTLVELEMTLYGAPTVVLRCVARVVNFVPPDGEEIPVGRFQTGMAFEAMNTEDRQTVVRYSFKLQRDQIREARDVEDEPDSAPDLAD